MKNINTLTMIAEPRAGSWDVVSWADGRTLIGRANFTTREDAAAAMEWARDIFAPMNVSVRIEWPPRPILFDDIERHKGQPVICVVPHNDGGIVAWNDGRDRLEFPTWDAAEAFAIELNGRPR